MPFKSLEERSAYNQKYYQSKIKKKDSQTYDKPQKTFIPKRSKINDEPEYDTDDDEPTDDPTNEPDVDKEYNDFIEKKEYISYPYISPNIINNLQTIKPSIPSQFTQHPYRSLDALMNRTFQNPPTSYSHISFM